MLFHQHCPTYTSWLILLRRETSALSTKWHFWRAVIWTNQKRCPWRRNPRKPAAVGPRVPTSQWQKPWKGNKVVGHCPYHELVLNSLYIAIVCSLRMYISVHVQQKPLNELVADTTIIKAPSISSAPRAINSWYSCLVSCGFLGSTNVEFPTHETWIWGMVISAGTLTLN